MREDLPGSRPKTLATPRTPAADRRGGLVAIGAAAIALVAAAVVYFNEGRESYTLGDLWYASVFLVVDLANRILGARAARRVVYAGAALQATLYLLFIDVHYAIAAGSALLWGQLLNVWVFDRLRHRAWWQAPLLSSILAYTVDSVIFNGADLASTDGEWISVMVDDAVNLLPYLVGMVLPYRVVLRLLPPVWRDAPADR